MHIRVGDVYKTHKKYIVLCGWETAGDVFGKHCQAGRQGGIYRYPGCAGSNGGGVPGN